MQRIGHLHGGRGERVQYRHPDGGSGGGREYVGDLAGVFVAQGRGRGQLLGHRGKKAFQLHDTTMTSLVLS